MIDDNQGPIQLTPKQSVFPTGGKLKKVTIPKRILILLGIIVLIVVIILAVTFLPSRPQPIDNRPSNIPTASPFPTTDVDLGEISDPILKAINDRISQLQTRLRNLFNYQELLSVPIVDLSVSF